MPLLRTILQKEMTMKRRRRSLLTSHSRRRSTQYELYCVEEEGVKDAVAEVEEEEEVALPSEVIVTIVINLATTSPPAPN